MKIKFKPFGFLIIVCVVFYSCNLAPGTHGSIKEYVFNISKYNLQVRVDSVIVSSSSVDRLDDDVNSADHNYYNTDPYFTIIIDNVNYCFRYYGDSLNWDFDKSTEIFIVSITDYNKSNSVKKKHIEIVEKEFIYKLDYVTNVINNKEM